MSLVVPQGYNPYNTSLASIALQGLGMAQQEMNHRDAMAQQTFQNFMEVSRETAKNIQQNQENQFRLREEDRTERKMAWEQHIDTERLGIANAELDIRRAGLAEERRQFDVTTGLRSKEMDLNERKVSMMEAEEARVQEIHEKFGLANAAIDQASRANKLMFDSQNFDLTRREQEMRADQLNQGAADLKAMRDSLKAEKNDITSSFDADEKNLSGMDLSLSQMYDDLKKSRGVLESEPQQRGGGGGDQGPNAPATKVGGAGVVPSGKDAKAPSDNYERAFIDPKLVKDIEETRFMIAAARALQSGARRSAISLATMGDELKPEEKTKAEEMRDNYRAAMDKISARMQEMAKWSQSSLNSGFTTTDPTQAAKMAGGSAVIQAQKAEQNQAPTGGSRTGRMK